MRSTSVFRKRRRSMPRSSRWEPSKRAETRSAVLRKRRGRERRRPAKVPSPTPPLVETSMFRSTCSSSLLPIRSSDCLGPQKILIIHEANSQRESDSVCSAGLPATRCYTLIARMHSVQLSAITYYSAQVSPSNQQVHRKNAFFGVAAPTACFDGQSPFLVSCHSGK